MHSSSNYNYQPGRLHPSSIAKFSHPQYSHSQHSPSQHPHPQHPELPATDSQRGWARLPHSSMPDPTVRQETGLLLEHEVLRQTALAEAKEGNYVKAIALFDELLEQNPLSATDYNNRGLAHFKCHHHTQALADYNMAIALNATLDSVYNNRANYYAHHGDLLGALLDYDMAIDLNPYNVRALINQGITFRDLKMYGRAVECFDTAMNFGVLQDHIYLERGRTYDLRGDWNCAIADYQRVITYVMEISDQLGEREVRLLTQAQDWIDELLSPLAEF